MLKERHLKCLSPAAIVWQFAVAIKHGVCPLVEFVNEADVEKLEMKMVSDLLLRN